MTLIASVAQQHPIASRNYQDRNGAPQVFQSVGITLRIGGEYIYCEAVQERATALAAQPLTQNALYVVDLQFSARAYTAAGVERYQTEVRLTRINPL